MADEARIKTAIRDIAQKRKNVSFDEIEWVVEQIGGERVRKTRQGYLFRVGSRRFMINTHNPGSKQLKAYSVDDFVEALTERGWYED